MLRMFFFNEQHSILGKVIRVVCGILLRIGMKREIALE